MLLAESTRFLSTRLSSVLLSLDWSHLATRAGFRIDYTLLAISWSASVIDDRPSR